MKNEDTVENSYEPDMLMSPVKYAANCRRCVRRELLLGDKKLWINRNLTFVISFENLNEEATTVGDPIQKH